MIITQGQKYNFEIISETDRDDCIFLIKAIDKSSLKSSCINNLNAILSEFGIEINDKKSEESIWIVKNTEVQNLVNSATDFLSSSNFVKYLESQLDDDRSIGEWENIAQTR